MSGRTFGPAPEFHPAPNHTVRYIVPNANTDGSSNATPLRCSQTPMATAMGICRKTGRIDSGNILNTAAITRPKIASTIHRPNSRISRNRIRTRGFSTRPAMSPMVCPRFRRLMTKAPKSCTAPMKIDPNSTHIKAGTQPHMMAIAGPTIGPVPAMLVK